MFQKPVIGNKNCSAVASLISDGVNGFLCEKSEEMTQKIQLLLENRALRENFGKNGYELTVKEYTWDRIADKVLAVYQRLQSQYDGGPIAL
jgi:glycosyltransferase involved in cell wall biosynthesis